MGSFELSAHNRELFYTHHTTLLVTNPLPKFCVHFIEFNKPNSNEVVPEMPKY